MHVAIVGAGLVGIEMVRLLRKRNFPCQSITIFARSERTIVIDEIEYQVKVATPGSFSGMNFAFFAGTEGEKGASRALGWKAVEQGCIVIDNGDDFRMDPNVPLVIPEINSEALWGHRGFIANPNCSTIIALMALAPLHRKFKLKRIIASTYQAVSGSGTPGLLELEAQLRVKKEDRTARAFPYVIAGNVIPSVGSFRDDTGESTEEVKMRRETHKILDDPAIRIAATCVRVPVMRGHSIAINAEFVRPINVVAAREILAHAPWLRLIDDPESALYPMPVSASTHENVEVGRIRRDQSVMNGLALFVSGDNVGKGAAQNAIQIAECLMEMKLMRI